MNRFLFSLIQLSNCKYRIGAGRGHIPQPISQEHPKELSWSDWHYEEIGSNQMKR